MITLAVILSFLSIAPTHLDTYTMDLNLSASSGKLAGTIDLQYTNDSDSALESLMLRLDPNLSRDDIMIINAVADADDAPLEWAYKPKERIRLSSERGLMSVTLPKPLQPGQSAKLRITYRLSDTRMLNAFLLILQDDPYNSLDAWYPKAMSFIDGAWCDEDCRPAAYDITFHHDPAIDIATTGILVEQKKNDDGTATSRFHRAGMRGFTIYGSNSWTTQVKEVPGCTIRIHTAKQHQEWAEPFLKVAAEAVEFYRDYYGFFPTDHIELACFPLQGSGAFAGHGVCGFFMGKNLEEQYHFLVAHEIAHMYFGTYLGVSRDEINWVQIGLGLLADGDFMKAKGYPMKRHQHLPWYYFEAERRGYDTSLSQTLETIRKSDDKFWRMAFNLSLTHAKGMLVCTMLRDLIGVEQFNAMVRELLTENAGRLLHYKTFVDACQKASSGNIDWFVEDWITGNRTLDYHIAEVATDESGVWYVKIRNEGEARYPVSIDVTFADGATKRYTADISKREETFILPPAGQPTSVVIDPEGITPDLKPDNNGWPVKEESAKQ